MIEPRHCYNCKGANPPNGKFCHYCGFLLQSNAPSRKQTLIVLAVALLVALPFLYAISVALRDKSTGSMSTSVATTPSPLPPLTSTQLLSQAKELLNSKSKSEESLRHVRDKLQAVSQNDSHYKEAQATVKTLDSRLIAARNENAPVLRETLRAKYQATVAQANPHLNYINSKLTKFGKGYALWATHEFFSQYTLSIGNDAHVISEWISDNELKLKDAGIIRVGVMGEGPYASWSYFDVK